MLPDFTSRRSHLPGVLVLAALFLTLEATTRFKHMRKEFLRVIMSTDEPEITTVTSKGQITIPSRLREEFGIERGTKLLVVPTEYGLVLKKVDLPSVEEFKKRVEDRVEEVELSLDEVVELVHEAREE